MAIIRSSKSIFDNEISHGHQRLRQMRLQLMEADRRYDAIRQSRSWQATAPLRAISQKFPDIAWVGWVAVRALIWALSGELPVRVKAWFRARRQVREDMSEPDKRDDKKLDTPEIAFLNSDEFDLILSQQKHSILVVDAILPDPERSAGDRSSFHIQTTLVRNGFNVFSWYNSRQPDALTAARLSAQGIFVMDPDRIASLDQWLELYGNCLDYVLLARPELTRNLLPLFISKTAAKLIYYGHDLHYMRMQAEANLTSDPDLAERANRMLAIERSVWRLVDVVLYPSDSETAAVQRLEPRVTARTLTLCAYEKFIPRMSPTPGAMLLFVGSYGHPPNRDAAIWLVSEIFPQVLRFRPDAQLVLAGSGPTHSITALAAPKIYVPGRVTNEELSELYDRARIVVAPIRFGAGVKGKVLEALSCGVPVVTTLFGMQGIPNIESILTASDRTDKFVDAIVNLLNNDDLWMVQSAAQTKYASEHFSESAFSKSLMSAINA